MVPFLPVASVRGRPLTRDIRTVFNAIQTILATGCQRRALPQCFPPFTTMQYHFYKWRDSGVWDDLMEGCKAGRGLEPTVAVIDNPSVKTTESGGPCGYDAGKKIKGRKRHIAGDAEGFPVAVHVHTADIRIGTAHQKSSWTCWKGTTVTKLFAGGGYQGPKLRGVLKDRAVADRIEIVGKPKGIEAFTVLYRRWVVKRSFAWMGRCRCLAKDFKRTIDSSFAWVQRATCRFMMRRIARTRPIAAKKQCNA